MVFFSPPHSQLKYFIHTDPADLPLIDQRFSFKHWEIQYIFR